MFDGLSILLAVLLVVGFLRCLLVLPIVALVRTRRIGELTARLERLEQELHAARRAGAPEAAPSPAPAEAPLESVLIETPSLLPPVQPSPAPPSGPLRPAGAGIETWIGRQVLGWVAVVLALLASGFFIQLAFDNQWIGEMGQVALGVAAGTALCLIGYHYHPRPAVGKTRSERARQGNGQDHHHQQQSGDAGIREATEGPEVDAAGARILWASAYFRDRRRGQQGPGGGQRHNGAR
jgi:hypothetical protein